MDPIIEQDRQINQPPNEEPCHQEEKTLIYQENQSIKTRKEINFIQKLDLVCFFIEMNLKRAQNLESNLEQIDFVKKMRWFQRQKIITTITENNDLSFIKIKSGESEAAYEMIPHLKIEFKQTILYDAVIFGEGNSLSELALKYPS